MALPPDLPFEGRYNRYSSWLRNRYGVRTARVGVDGGFSCPNRGPDGRGGCSFCDTRGSRSPVLDDARSLGEQVDRTVAFLRGRYGAEALLLYFQAFTSTYAPVNRLKRIYDETLARFDFRGLIVSTRPDCLDSERADLLASYAGRGLDVWVELGLQSSNDETLRRIGRGHTVRDFDLGLALLRERGLPVSVHVIFGLPGETEEDMLGTIRFIAERRIEGVKIHDLHVPYGCALYYQALAGEFALLSPQRHLDLCVRALELLPPRTLIQRLSTDTPQDRRALPRHPMEKARFYRLLDMELDRLDTYQGRLYIE